MWEPDAAERRSLPSVLNPAFPLSKHTPLCPGTSLVARPERLVAKGCHLAAREPLSQYHRFGRIGVMPENVKRLRSKSLHELSEIGGAKAMLLEQKHPDRDARAHLRDNR